MYGTHDGRDRAVAWAAVLVTQGMIAAWLLRDGLPPPIAPASDDALQIELIRRKVSTRAATTVSTAVRVPSARSRTEVGEAASSTSNVRAQRGGHSAAVVSIGPVPLDLHVPEPAPTFAPRDPFARRASRDAQATRFEAHWAPAGNALDQAAFRSRAAAIVLHAFGGPSRHCDESERRRRLPDCLPLTAQEEEDERLRRSLDP